LTWIRDQLPGNNYFASTGATLCPWTSASPPGIFATETPGIDSIRAIRDIQDGTSNTIAFGEWKTGDFNISKASLTDAVNLQVYTVNGVGGWNDPMSQMPTGAANFPGFLQACAGALPGSINNWRTNKSHMGRSWVMGMHGYTLGNTLLPPNPNYPNCNLEPWGGDLDAPTMIGLSSNHPGGANVAFADGSVRFLKASTRMEIVWALGSRGGGEAISSDSY
jgi:prepilin-type processing-associated H-X9-DG protein